MPRLDLPEFRPITSRNDLPPHDTEFLPDGAQLLLPDALRRLLVLAPMTLRNRRLVLIDGKAGCGKSTALAALAAASPVRTAKVAIRNNWNSRRLVGAIHEAVTGDASDRSQSWYEDHLLVALSREPTLLLLDEAQNASLPVLRDLRLMLESPGARFAMVLSGYGIGDHIRKESMLLTWRGHVANFSPLDHVTLLPTLRQLHPALAATSDRLLVEADRIHCRGLLREWAVLLETLLAFAPHGPFTSATITDAIDAVSGQRPTLL
jgi:hypothetical protein